MGDVFRFFWLLNAAEYSQKLRFSTYTCSPMGEVAKTTI